MPFHLRSAYEDEADVLVGLSRINPLKLQLNPRLYTAYGGIYFYLLGACIALASILTPLKLVPSLGFYLAHLEQLWWLYLAGRLLSVAAYVASVLLAYAIGRKLWDEWTGFWAGLFFAVCPGTVFQAHYMKSHPVGVVALMGMFYFCGAILRGQDDRGQWLWVGAMLGLAAGATNYLWSAVVFLPMTAWLSSRRMKPAVLAFGCAVIVYFITNPFLVTEFETSLRLMAGSVHHASLDIRYIWKFPFEAYPKALTVPLALWTLAGLLALEWKDPVWTLTASGLLYYFCFTWMGQSPDRLISIRHFPGIFLGFLLAGRLVSREIARNGKRRRLAAVLAAVAAAYAFSISGVMDYNYYREACGHSTKDEAGAWIENNIPKGSQIGLLRLPQPANTPYFQWNQYRLQFVGLRTIKSAGGRELLPEHLVLTAASYDDRLELASLLEKRYELLKVFHPFSLRWLGIPEGEICGNPVVSIYRKELKH